jgi:phosphate:Na+ symporter
MTVIIALMGGLGLFFYGMKLMSEGLQALTGEIIRKAINALSSHRVLAVLIGAAVTAIIQSSSITSVMTVGLVNASLMSLKQAIAVIFGANVGKTITGWIFSLNRDGLGFLLIAFGFMPALFAKNNRTHHFGKSVMGLGLLFLGLSTLKNALLPLASDPQFKDSLQYFTTMSYGPWITAVLLGCVLTMVIQSSAAMLGLTMCLGAVGLINFPTAVSMVLGENIGTTVTAVLASVGANANARRTALAHAFFNIFGVLIVLCILPFFFDFLDWLVPGSTTALDSQGLYTDMVFHIAAAHTLFNVMSTLLFLPFVDHLVKFVSWLVPDESRDRDVPHLLLLGNPQDLLPATSLVQAETEIRKLADIVGRMYLLTKEYWSDSEDESKKLHKIVDYERITDNIHKELTVFLCFVMERPLSHQQSEQTQALIKIADELESVADYLERLASYRERFKGGVTLEGESRKEFFEFMDEVWSFYCTCTLGLYNKSAFDLEKIVTKSDELQIWADSIREKHLDRISKGAYKPVTALTFSDMVVALRKIRTHSFHMARAVEAFNLETE